MEKCIPAFNDDVSVVSVLTEGVADYW